MIHEHTLSELETRLERIKDELIDLTLDARNFLDIHCQEQGTPEYEDIDYFWRKCRGIQRAF